MQNYLNQIFHDDLFNTLPKIEDKSIDCVIADLPYDMVRCNWDCAIDLNQFWKQILRITKENSPIILFGSQPFTSILVSSNIKIFKYEYIWEKSKGSNFLDCNRRPMKVHESVLVFCKGTVPYYPQMVAGKAYDGKKRVAKNIDYTTVYGKVKDPFARNNNSGTRYPRSVQYFKTAESEGKQLHPTQKPLALLQYLIKTHSQINEVILDPVMGSGTTIIAAIKEKRQFIGIEKYDKYYEIAKTRIDNTRKEA